MSVLESRLKASRRTALTDFAKRKTNQLRNRRRSQSLADQRMRSFRRIYCQANHYSEPRGAGLRPALFEKLNRCTIFFSPKISVRGFHRDGNSRCASRSRWGKASFPRPAVAEDPLDSSVRPTSPTASLLL